MTRRIPSLNWLRVFEAAARTGSFARAAERLGMSPPAVSQQIRALEDHLGRQLFARAAAGVTLTEAGRRLLSAVGEPLGRMEDAALSLSSRQAPAVTLGVSLILLTGWLAPRLPEFLARHPEVTLDLRTLVGHPETPPRDADLWIAFGQPPAGVAAVPLFGEWLQPVATPELCRRITAPGDLLDHTLIEVSDHRRNWAQIFGGDVLPRSARLLHVDTTSTALTLAAAGAGIALARPPASDALVTLSGLRPCLPDLRLRGVERHFLMSGSAGPMSKGARVVQAWIEAEAEATRSAHDV